MTRRRDALAFALFGFVFATLVQLPSILDAYAPGADRNPVFAQDFRP